MPGARRARPPALLVLALLVLCLHAWLASRWWPGPPRSSLRPGPAPTLQVRQLGVLAPHAPPVAGAPLVAKAPRADATPLLAPPLQLPQAAETTVAAAPTRTELALASTSAAAVAARPSAVSAASATATATATASPSEAAAAHRAELAAGVDLPDASADEGGTPPPVYPTRLPAPTQLHYALSYNGRPGEATLRWQHDGQRYAMTLDGVAQATGRPLLAQASQGALDANGLAPDRFVDRRGGGRQQAANFRRDIERIGFSGPPRQFPAWPGAQDRLSWLAQLAAILAAGHAEPEVRMFVVDARGQGGSWRLQRLPDERLATPSGEVWMQRWQREPPRPEGLQVQAWLDPTRGHWPALLRFTALRSGDVIELRLQGEPEPR